MIKHLTPRSKEELDKLPPYVEILYVPGLRGPFGMPGNRGTEGPVGIPGIESYIRKMKTYKK